MGFASASTLQSIRTALRVSGERFFYGAMASSVVTARQKRRPMSGVWSSSRIGLGRLRMKVAQLELVEGPRTWLASVDSSPSLSSASATEMTRMPSNEPRALPLH